MGATKIELFVIATVMCALCQSTRHYDQQEAERYIIESERQWAESVASGNTTVVQRIFADDFICVDPKGHHYGKSQMISDTLRVAIVDGLFGPILGFGVTGAGRS